MSHDNYALISHAMEPRVLLLKGTAGWTLPQHNAENAQVAYTLAQRLGKLCRALTWGRLLAHLSPAERWQYETSYAYWLRVFLGTEE